MTHEGNGDKTKIILWLVGIIQALLVAWAIFISSNTVQAKTDVAVLKSQYSQIMDKVTETDKKVDKLYEVLSLRRGIK